MTSSLCYTKNQKVFVKQKENNPANFLEKFGIIKSVAKALVYFFNGINAVFRVYKLKAGIN